MIKIKFFSWYWLKFCRRYKVNPFVSTISDPFRFHTKEDDYRLERTWLKYFWIIWKSQNKTTKNLAS